MDNRPSQPTEWDTSRTAAFSLVMVTHTALDGRWLKVPPTLCKLLDYAEEELLSQSLGDVSHPDDREADWNQRERLIRGEVKSVEREKRFLRKDGVAVWVYANCSIVTDAEGKPDHFLVYLRDITREKLAEEKLEYSLSLLRATLESTADGILVVDTSGRIASYNRKFVEMWRIPESVLTTGEDEQVLQFVLNQLMAPEQFLAKVRELYTHPEAESFDTLGFKDGRIFERFSQPQRTGGRIVGRVWSFRDITERRRAEQALRKKEASLLEAQRIGHVGSWEVDLKMNSLWWSDETFRIFGFKPAKHVPTNESFFATVHPLDHELVKKAVQTAVREHKPYSVDHRIIRPDGCERLVHERAEIVLDARGEAVQMIGTVQDITDRMNLEEQLRQLQKMETVGQLAAGVAHDFNNILTVIQGHTDLLTGDEQTNERARESLQEIATAVERAINLTRQLLTFSRKQVTQPRLLDLNELVANLSKMLQRVLGEHIALEFKPTEGLPAIHADPGMMEQIITNLVVNARDACPHGGRMTITTNSAVIDEDYIRQNPEARSGQFVCLNVTDSGCGMNVATMRRIFEPFYTTKEVGKGTGLGLATVYGIVKQHQGWVEVTSQIGKGSCFRVFLPARVEAPATLSRKPLAMPRNRGKETILLVEDEPAVCGMARLILERQGYRVHTASSGVRALKVWEEHRDRIDLLLTDMVMPEGMTGQVLAQKLLEQKPELKIIYSSGYSIELMGQGSELKQGMAFLPKPYQPQKLVQFVRDVLDGQVKKDS